MAADPGVRGEPYAIRIIGHDATLLPIPVLGPEETCQAKYNEMLKH